MRSGRRGWLFGAVLPVAALVAFANGCSSNAAGDEQTEEGNLTAGELDDNVAKTLLAGGCSVEVDGRVTKTAGSGGPCPTKLSGMLDILEGKVPSAGAKVDPSRVFVVSEDGDVPGPRTSYRFVVGSKANNAPLWIATVSGPQAGEDGVEAMGFSPSRKAWAFYRVEGGTWVRKGDGSQVKSSTRGKDRPFECITCHSSGAPLMKELHDSWANWDSTWFSMPEPPGANALFKRLFDARQLADELEIDIIEGTHLHSQGRVERAIKDNELSGVLTQLMCEVGEPSIIGAHSSNDKRFGKVETFSTMLPTSLLLNSLWDAPETGGTGTELGLEQALGVKTGVENVGFKIDATAYANALEKNGQTINGRPGDAMFPMSSPQSGYADLDAVQELLRRKLIDNDIVADILMVDPTVSSYSKIRCDLAETLPKTWKNPDELRTAWAAALGGSNLRGAKGLKARLENKNDLKNHERALKRFVSACAARPDAELTVDAVELISQRRVEFTARYGGVGQGIVESASLIPLDKLGSKPNAKRLNATTCKLEPASTEFLGENDAAAVPEPTPVTPRVTDETHGPIPTARLVSGASFKVVAEQLNCRRNAGTEHGVVQKVMQGDVVTALNFNSTAFELSTEGQPWVFVKTQEGKKCFLSAKFQFITAQ